MPIMKKQALLFREPRNDAETVNDENVLRNTSVAVLAKDNGFLKITALDNAGEPQGWVFENTVDLEGKPATGPIDKAEFALQCWREALDADANPHYMAAVAELRSQTATGEDSGRVGPFRLSQAEWDAARTGDATSGDVRASDIRDWRLQCALFAVMAHNAEEKLRTELQKAPAGPDPSAAHLYLAQLIDPVAAAAAIKNPTSNITVPFPSPGTPVQVQADAVIKQIADALQPVLDSTRAAVTQAGTTLLGSAQTEGVVTKAGDPLSKDLKVPAGDFAAKAPTIMAKLMSDFALTDVQAAAILGNIGHECAGFRHMQEIAPLQGGRGGLGWCQWTGSRRVSFENFLAKRNAPSNDDKANYDYLKQELQGKPQYDNAIRDLKQTSTLEAGVKAFELAFEKANIHTKGYPSRNKFGKTALDAFKAHPPSAGT
jgi:hypothetical protein